MIIIYNNLLQPNLKMKFTLIAVLVASAQAVMLQSHAEPVWSLRSVKAMKNDAAIQGNYGTFSTTMSNKSAESQPYASGME